MCPPTPAWNPTCCSGTSFWLMGTWVVPQDLVLLWVGPAMPQCQGQEGSQHSWSALLPGVWTLRGPLASSHLIPSVLPDLLAPSPTPLCPGRYFSWPHLHSRTRSQPLNLIWRPLRLALPALQTSSHRAPRPALCSSSSSMHCVQQTCFCVHVYMLFPLELHPRVTCHSPLPFIVKCHS